MKYRIIKRIDQCGDEYYLIQHYDPLGLNWETIEESVWYGCYRDWKDQKFTSIKEAKKCIKKAVEREKNLNTPAVVVYEEEA